MTRAWMMVWLMCGLAMGSIEASIESRSAEHEHGPRHGGFFGDAEDQFHYELVLDQDRRLVFYVNDEDNQPLDVRTLQGRWALSPDSPAPVAGTFTPSSDGAYFITELPELPEQAEALYVEVAVLKHGAWVPMEFSLPVPRGETEQAGLPSPLPH